MITFLRFSLLCRICFSMLKSFFLSISNHDKIFLFLPLTYFPRLIKPIWYVLFIMLWTLTNHLHEGGDSCKISRRWCFQCHSWFSYNWWDLPSIFQRKSNATKAADRGGILVRYLVLAILQIVQQSLKVQRRKQKPCLTC